MSEATIMNSKEFDTPLPPTPTITTYLHQTFPASSGPLPMFMSNVQQRGPGQVPTSSCPCLSRTRLRGKGQGLLIRRLHPRPNITALREIKDKMDAFCAVWRSPMSSLGRLSLPPPLPAFTVTHSMPNQFLSRHTQFIEEQTNRRRTKRFRVRSIFHRAPNSTLRQGRALPSPALPTPTTPLILVPVAVFLAGESQTGRWDGDRNTISVYQ
ncbi:hypothetical protein C0Q70_18073 [Pomacea canaliculata]|uniref:Uncharacterized protein n=1 Tax=Pomacea canaliculata TaxID=400727 RepID=A0A2T7NM70_POMCA|nr:hypothetical protein C0Q70_18073 [Pomacea canaliculata]